MRSAEQQIPKAGRLRRPRPQTKVEGFGAETTSIRPQHGGQSVSAWPMPSAQGRWAKTWEGTGPTAHEPTIDGVLGGHASLVSNFRLPEPTFG